MGMSFHRAHQTVTFPQILNDYANQTNGWRNSSGLNLNENGYVQQNSASANSRAAFKLIKYGTVSEDNIGDLNTTILQMGNTLLS